MSLQNLLNQFIAPPDAAPSRGNATAGITSTLGKLTGNLPGGLAGGAAAGGIMALLIGNKKARKYAGKAASYGGAAVLGGLAYRAFQNWQQNSSGQEAVAADAQGRNADVNDFVNDAQQPSFDLKLIQAMIAAAKADGQIDSMEHQHIFDTVEQMDLSIEMRGKVFDLLRHSIPVAELARGVESIEQKSELYLASCLVMTPDHPAELAHLEELAMALELPAGLAEQLQSQARQAMLEGSA